MLLIENKIKEKIIEMDLAREAVYDKYQENSIEFLLDYAPDVILLYMVYVHY